MKQDKLFVESGGITLLERTVRACESVFAETVIVARETAKFISLSKRIVLDVPDVPGPVAGLIAALEDCTGEAAFITAADLLDLSETVVRSLLRAYAGEDYLGVREPDRLQPLCGIYSISVLPHLKAMAADGIFALHQVLSELETGTVSVPQARWRNINRPNDLEGGADHV